MINIIKVVIFDLDGTLLDTLGDLHAAVNHALSAFSFPERSIEEGMIPLAEALLPSC